MYLKTVIISYRQTYNSFDQIINKVNSNPSFYYLMSLFQSTNLNEIQSDHKTYSYVVFGSQRVGKTNIVTRFVKDQFTEAHNMTLQGQQSSIINIDSRKFQILLHDTAGTKLIIHTGQQNLLSMKAVWRGHKDGYVFVYAIDKMQTFIQLMQQIREIKANQLYKNIPAIVIGNKLDLKNSREVDRNWAINQVRKFNIKLIQISAKTSPRQQIQKIFIQIIQMNEMNLYSQIQGGYKSTKNTIYGKGKWWCCNADEDKIDLQTNNCSIY